MAGSKFDGTGFEKEHIGHTHVAFTEGVGACTGVLRLLGSWDDAVDEPPGGVLTGLGYRVILGDDFRNRA